MAAAVGVAVSLRASGTLSHLILTNPCQNCTVVEVVAIVLAVEMIVSAVIVVFLVVVMAMAMVQLGGH